MNPSIVTLVQGHLPLVVSIPHGGEFLPESFAQRMMPAARQVADTDWHLARLYDFARAMGASIVRANYSRYVVDLNRPSNGDSLYPGQTTTGLCPTESFRGEPLYADGAAPPDTAEIAQRVAQYWQPYHEALHGEIARLRAQRGRAGSTAEGADVEVGKPAFEQARQNAGDRMRLPEQNVPVLRDAAVAAAAASPFTWVVDDRFKGGYITRHYGQPHEGLHAVQLEMVQCLYMDESDPFAYREDRAARVLPTLETMVKKTLAALADAT